jgi:soluble lytic murein transglycosylase
MDDMERTLKVGLMFPSRLFAGASVAAGTLLLLATASGATAQTAPAAQVTPATAPAPAAAPAATPATAAPATAVVSDAQREQDEIFLQLREAARKNDTTKAAELAAKLPSYAIPSYVDYYRLKPRLRDASNE